MSYILFIAGEVCGFVEKYLWWIIGVGIVLGLLVWGVILLAPITTNPVSIGLIAGLVIFVIAMWLVFRKID